MASRNENLDALPAGLDTRQKGRDRKENVFRPDARQAALPAVDKPE